jgi:hypothetical protein
MTAGPMLSADTSVSWLRPVNTSPLFVLLVVLVESTEWIDGVGLLGRNMGSISAVHGGTGVVEVMTLGGSFCNLRGCLAEL